MYILGVSFLADTGAVLLKDGVLLEAVNEERFNRNKLTQDSPRMAVKYLLEKYKLRMDDIDCVATHGALDPSQMHLNQFLIKEKEIISSEISNQKEQLISLWSRYAREKYVRNVRTKNHLASLREFRDELKIYKHHHCHAASAAYMSGFDECHVLTMDGWGEDGSATWNEFKAFDLVVLDRTPTFSSLGYFYGAITKFLGFTPHKDEGKTLGMSAYGDSQLLYPIFSKMIKYNSKKKTFDGLYEEGIYVADFDNPNLSRVLEGYKKEDIAAAAQKILEDVVVDFLNDRMDKPGNLAVAGGIFANILLNKKIIESTPVKSIYIFPHMGDGGLSHGAAMLCHREVSSKPFVPPKTMYLGSGFSDEEIEEELIKCGVSYEAPQDVEEEVATLLVDRNVVAVVSGRMEYGPRALGGRSVLVHPNDRKLANWVNKQLQRPDFMPFGPVTLAEEASKYYLDIERYYPNTSFMTIGVMCTDFMKEHCEGCVHVDGTARPQLISMDQNPAYYKILKQFFKKTGIATLINTSFNIHEEPIVCTPEDAIRSIKSTNIQYLMIGKFLVHNTGTESS
jgi:carbamoyltransferase